MRTLEQRTAHSRSIVPGTIAVCCTLTVLYFYCVVLMAAMFDVMTQRDKKAAEPQFNLRADPTECVAANRSLCAMSCNNKDGLCNKWVTNEQALTNNASYLKAFSAVCFLTVRDIKRIATEHAGNGGRPVALVQSAWGGTRVEVRHNTTHSLRCCVFGGLNRRYCWDSAHIQMDI